MSAPTLRLVKGSILTHAELDGNFAVRFVSVAHGLTVGTLMRPSDPGWVKAQADSMTNRAQGAVIAVEDVDTVWIGTHHGIIFTWTAHGKGAVGTRLYTSQSTPGGCGGHPGTGLIQPFYSVVSANSMMIDRSYQEFV